MSVFSYLITILSIMFWILRAVVSALFTSGVDFPIQPLNITWEIAVVFLTIPAMIFVLKRNIIGAACYMAIYVSYFGTAIYNSVNNISDTLNVSDTAELFFAIIGVVLPVLTFVDILLNKHRKSILGSHKSTDWYYKDDKYERKFDDRADKNQYKIR